MTGLLSLLLVWWYAFLLFHLSNSETVSLFPSGNVRICPNESPTFVCRTTGGPLLWETTVSSAAGAVGKLIDDTTATNLSLGIFRLHVLDVLTVANTAVEVNSTATTLDGLRSEDDNTTLSCFLATNFIRKEAILKLAGIPQPPPMTSMTSARNGVNNSSLSLSWSTSHCAVLYVVAINSSDGSVYPNITTSDTNTTVTLPNGVEYCVTVAAVDAIGRRGQDSLPSCYSMLDKSTPSSTINVDTSTNHPFHPVSTSLLKTGTSILTGTHSPTQSPVVIGGVSLIAVVLPLAIVVTLLIGVLIFVGIVIAVHVFLLRKRKESKDIAERSSVEVVAVMSM